MRDLIEKVEELIELLEQIEKLIIRTISVVGWIIVLIAFFT